MFPCAPGQEGHNGSSGLDGTDGTGASAGTAGAAGTDGQVVFNNVDPPSYHQDIEPIILTPDTCTYWYLLTWLCYGPNCYLISWDYLGCW